MKMVRCHVKYTVLRGQLETYFELMELVLFFILHFKCNLSRCTGDRRNRKFSNPVIKAVNACRMPESNAGGREGAMGQGLSPSLPIYINCPVRMSEKLLFFFSTFSVSE